MIDRLCKIANWLGRKFIALMLSLTFLLAGGIFKPDKLSQIAPAIVGLYLAFVGGHAASDIMNSKNNPVKMIETKVDETKVEQKTVDAD